MTIISITSTMNWLQSQAAEYVGLMSDHHYHQAACYGCTLYVFPPRRPGDVAEFELTFGSPYDQARQASALSRGGIPVVQAEGEQEGGTYDDEGNYVPSDHAVADTREYFLQQAASFEFD